MQCDVSMTTHNLWLSRVGQNQNRTKVLHLRSVSSLFKGTVSSLDEPEQSMFVQNRRYRPSPAAGLTRYTVRTSGWVQHVQLGEGGATSTENILNQRLVTFSPYKPLMP